MLAGLRAMLGGAGSLLSSIVGGAVVQTLFAVVAYLKALVLFLLGGADGGWGGWGGWVVFGGAAAQQGGGAWVGEGL